MTTVSAKSLPPMIKCECGDTLNRMSVLDAFGSSVRCNQCQKKLKTSHLAYHCHQSHCFCLECAAQMSSNNMEGLKPIYCACQTIMQLSKPSICYGSSHAYCNNAQCRTPIQSQEYVNIYLYSTTFIHQYIMT